MEGTVASVPPQGGRKHPQQEFLQVDTTNILFICGGAFAGLDKIISAVARRPRSASVRRSRRKTIVVLAKSCANWSRKTGQVRPHPGIHRSSAGSGNARGSRRGRSDPDPVRAEERACQAVPAPVRDGRRGLTFHEDALREIARKAITRKTGAVVFARSWKDPARHDVRTAGTGRRSRSRHFRRRRQRQFPPALHLCRPPGRKGQRFGLKQPA